jgi:hypothetical protein
VLLLAVQYPVQSPPSGKAAVADRWKCWPLTRFYAMGLLSSSDNFLSLSSNLLGTTTSSLLHALSRAQANR